MPGNENSGRRQVALDTPQLIEFRRRGVPPMTKIFNKQMKMLQEDQRRVEEVQFSDKFWDKKRNTGVYSSSVSKSIRDIGQLLVQLGTLYLRIQKEAKAHADSMSFEEKIQTVADFANDLGKAQAAKFLTMMWPVIHELEKKTSVRNQKQIDALAKGSPKPTNDEESS